MEQLKNGDILLCTSDRFIPNLIKKVTKSQFNHAAIYFEVWGKPGVIEAQADGINWKPLKDWRNKYNYTFLNYRDVTLDKEGIKEVAKRAFSRCGVTAYDFESFIIRQPLKIITGKWRNRGEKESDKMICSEFVAWVYNIKHWENMTPKDVKRALDQSIDFRKMDLFY